MNLTSHASTRDPPALYVGINKGKGGHHQLAVAEGCWEVIAFWEGTRYCCSDPLQ